LCCLHSTGGQTCINDVDDVQRSGSDQTSNNRIVIVPPLSFTCNGRITNIRIRLEDRGTQTNFPCIQVWRQSSTSLSYNLVEKVQIQSNHLNTVSTYQEAIISLTDNNRIQFLSGDVIGFYNPPDSGYVIRDKTTMGYKFYVFIGSNASSLNLSTGITRTDRQPLIQFTLGECGNNHYFNEYCILQHDNYCITLPVFVICDHICKNLVQCALF